jgi:hypothetical protein
MGGGKTMNDNTNFRQLAADEGRLAIALRDGGYTIPVAIADLIDNAVAAGATLVDVTINGGPLGYQVVIADNGHGMSIQGLEDALRYGSSQKISQSADRSLNKYGIGLKAAGTSIGKTLTIVSRTEDGSISALQLPVELIEKEGKFGVVDLEPSAESIRKINVLAGPNKPGTIVQISDCDRLEIAIAQAEASKTDFEKKLYRHIEDHLSIVFCDYISGSMTITFNGEKLVAPDLFPSEHSVGAVTTYTIAGQTITVEGFVLPPVEELEPADSKRFRISNVEDRMGLQGVFVFRGGRAMVVGGWLNMRKSHTDIYGVRFKISFAPGILDEILNMDFKKSVVDLPNEIEHQIIEQAAQYRVEFNKALTQVRAKKRAEKRDDGHELGNVFIQKHHDEIQRIKIVNDNGGSTVQVRGPWTPAPYTIETKDVDREGQGPRVVKVTSLPNDALWEPRLAKQDDTVRDFAVVLNTSHEFYVKAWEMLESAGQINAIRVLDIIFFGLAQAEWCGTDDKERASLRHWRLEVSKYLEKAGANLPKALSSELSQDE